MKTIQFLKVSLVAAVSSVIVSGCGSSASKPSASPTPSNSKTQSFYTKLGDLAIAVTQFSATTSDYPTYPKSAVANQPSGTFVAEVSLTAQDDSGATFKHTYLHITLPSSPTKVGITPKTGSGETHHIFYGIEPNGLVFATFAPPNVDSHGKQGWTQSANPHARLWESNGSKVFTTTFGKLFGK